MTEKTFERVLSVNIDSSFIKHTIAKIIEKLLAKKLGVCIELLFNDMKIEIKDGKAFCKLGVCCQINTDDVQKLLETNNII